MRGMVLSRYLKPASVVALFVVLGGAWYWIEHRPRAEDKQTSGNALVIVAKSTNACFSDVVRGTGFMVPRREAVAGVDQEGSRVTDVLVREGEMVTDNQELARLTPGDQAGARSSPGASSLRAPAAGLVTEVQHHRRCAGLAAGRTDVSHRRQQRDRTGRRGAGRPHAQAQRGRERPHQPRQRARAGRAGPAGLAADRSRYPARPRPDFGADNPSLKVGMFARANIDAKRSCGVAVPRTAIDHLTVQVVKGNTVETRRVRVGLVSDTSTEILEGLEVGEIVVADAGTSLHDGDRIKTMFAEDLDRTRVR